MKNTTIHVGAGIGRIFAGTLKKNSITWDKKVDVTEDAVASVFTWFSQHMKGRKDEEFSITFSSSEYELVMRRKDGENT